MVPYNLFYKHLREKGSDPEMFRYLSEKIGEISELKIYDVVNIIDLFVIEEYKLHAIYKVFHHHQFYVTVEVLNCIFHILENVSCHYKLEHLKLFVLIKLIDTHRLHNNDLFFSKLAEVAIDSHYYDRMVGLLGFDPFFNISAHKYYTKINRHPVNYYIYGEKYICSGLSRRA